MEEKYGATINGKVWEIDLERNRLINLEDPKLIRRLSKNEIKCIKEVMKR